MVKLNYKDIIEIIKKEKGLSEEEINEKIREKIDRLSGLISEEGAAHIVANELGIKLFTKIGERIEIRNLIPGMRNIELVGRVIRKYEISQFERNDGTQGKVGSVIVSDGTGILRVVFWNELTEVLKDIKEGDIVKFVNGYIKDNNGRLEMHLNINSKVIINPEGVTLPDNTDLNLIRKNIDKLKQDDSGVQIRGYIVQVFDIRKYAICKECGKKLEEKQDGYYCSIHGKVDPNYAYVLNVVVDDGTSYIRAVFFKKQLEHLLNMNEQEIINLNKEDYEKIKQDLLGKEVLLTGRVSYNTMFNRLEFIVQRVDTIDHDSWLKELDKQIESLKEELNNKGIKFLDFSEYFNQTTTDTMDIESAKYENGAVIKQPEQNISNDEKDISDEDKETNKEIENDLALDEEVI